MPEERMSRGPNYAEAGSAASQLAQLPRLEIRVDAPGIRAVRVASWPDGTELWRDQDHNGDDYLLVELRDPATGHERCLQLLREDGGGVKFPGIVFSGAQDPERISAIDRPECFRGRFLWFLGVAGLLGRQTRGRILRFRLWYPDPLEIPRGADDAWWDANEDPGKVVHEESVQLMRMLGEPCPLALPMRELCRWDADAG